MTAVRRGPTAEGGYTHFEAKDEPDIVGHTLAYLGPYWQAFHVWMVLDPDWGWEKKRFLGADAVAEDFEAKDASIIEGCEVKLGTKLTQRLRDCPMKEVEIKAASSEELVRRFEQLAQTRGVSLCCGTAVIDKSCPSPKPGRPMISA
jgi:hypothetical protein